MTDLQAVIKGIEACLNYKTGAECEKYECPYLHSMTCTSDLMFDALQLLKAQDELMCFFEEILVETRDLHLEKGDLHWMADSVLKLMDNIMRKKQKSKVE